MNNFYFMLDSKTNASPVALNISTFFNKLKSSETTYTFEELTLNKLNINKELVIDNNSYNIETLLLLNIKLN